MKFNSVLIVDDHAAMRIGLKELLKGFQPMLKFYESEDGDSMIEILKNHSIDLVMLDYHLPLPFPAYSYRELHWYFG